MGGRGSSSGKQSENTSQLRDTIYRAAVSRAKYYEYKDASGKTVTGETAKAFSGAFRERVAASAAINKPYKGAYSADVAQYAKMSDAQLNAELKRYQEQSDEANNAFHMGRAYSRLAGASMSELAASKQIGLIKRILERRKKGGLYQAIRL